MSRALSLELRDDGIAVVTLDMPGQEVNTLRGELAQEFDAVLAEIATRADVEAMVLGSGKREGFIAGADLNALGATSGAGEASALSRLMQDVTRRIRELPVVTVAAIHGDCLGGGLELALGFDSRVASDDPATRLALPEVQLGLLPGGGGTQYLAPLVGLPTALDMMLTGRRLGAARALRTGLVDRVVPAHELLDAALDQARELLAGGRRARAALRRRPLARAFSSASLMHWLLARNPVGRQLAFTRARRDVLRKTRGLYPAPLRIVQVVRTGLARGVAVGLEAEALAFGELAVSPQSRALVGLFFATTELKKDPGTENGTVAPGPVEHVAVVGAGLMGAGIAYVSALAAGARVTLRDRELADAARGRQHVDDALQQRVRRGRMSDAQRDEVMERVSAAPPRADLEGVDLVIEAVYEDLALKQQVLAEVEATTGEAVIFASNTSAIPISRIAESSARPGRVIGMHYFSPVERMPLLEVVATAQTSPHTVATCVAFGRRQGKTVVVVRDGPGFYTTRILAPYMNEAARMLSEGHPVQSIDEALLDFGFPVGPLSLLDDVGIDVGAKVAEQMAQAFGARMRAPGSMAGLLEDGRQGRKNRRGFYRYRGVEGRRRGVDASVYAAVGAMPDPAREPDGVAERCVLLMVNEAVRCFQERVLRSARDGDVAAVFGLGFPPFLGGPLRYVDHLTPGALADRLHALADRHGERFEPAGLLRDMAADGTTFHGERAILPR